MKKLKTVVNKTLACRQQRTGIHEGWKPYEVSCMIFLENASRLWFRERGPWWSPAISLSWEDGAGNPGGPRWLEVIRQNTKEERVLQTKSSRHPKRAPRHIFSWVLITMCMWQNYPRLGKEPTESTGGNFLLTAYRAAVVPDPVPMSQKRKFHNS